MNIEVIDKGPFSSAMVHLDPGEQFISEAGNMTRMTSNVDVDVTTRTKGKGGMLAGLKRMVGKDAFFLAKYSVLDDQPAHVGLSPMQMGSIKQIDLDGSGSWICAGGSYMASGTDIVLDTEFQGLKGFLTGESIFFIRASGIGPLLVTAYGMLREIDVNGELIVDTGHIVAYSDSLNYTVTKVAGGWINTWLSGEGFVLKLSGKGKAWVQSHNLSEFGRILGPMLPER